MKQQNVLVSTENPENYLPIFVYPNPKLREKVQKVTKFDQELIDLVTKMKNTMYRAQGLGLAAPQVGLALDLFIMDLSEEKNKLQVFINPVLTEFSDPKKGLEGCLSFPGVTTEIERFDQVKGTFQTLYGETLHFESSGLEAIAIQHEMDHLKGVLIYDKVSRLKQRNMTKRIDKLMKKVSYGK